MNITLVNGADSNVFRSLKEITAKLPSFELTEDMLKNSPALEGVGQIIDDLQIVNRDTFEKSGTDELTPGEIQTGEVMDYNSSLDFKISAGMSREQLATHYGDLGKKLDEEYAAGNISEEEYRDLNAQLMESYDSAITRCERKAASDEVNKAELLEKEAEVIMVNVRKRRNRTNIENILEGMGIEIKDGYVNSREMAAVNTGELKDIIEELTESLKNGPDEDYTGEKMTPEQHRAADIKAKVSARNRRIDQFAAMYCATDRGAMASMMNTVRRGGELGGGRDTAYGSFQAQKWLDPSYTPLPDNIIDYMKLMGT